MTGRENIYMNGSIMGMTRAEINSKLDAIVDFAGVERYLDTPVKRYSSGMIVRLGFAVAAFLEPEILVVDEVLAVGDAEFQKKAIGKMQDVSRGEGRTVLFVSHNMAAVRSLCSRGIVLDQGKMVFDGEITDSVEYYLSLCRNAEADVDFNNRDVSSKRAFVSQFAFVNKDSEIIDQLSFNAPLRCRFTIQSQEPLSVSLRIVLFDMDNNRVLALDSRDEYGFFKLTADKPFTIECQTVDKLGIKPGKYKVNISLRQGAELLDYIPGVKQIDVAEEPFFSSGRFDAGYLPTVLKRHYWNVLG